MFSKYHPSFINFTTGSNFNYRNFDLWLFSDIVKPKFSTTKMWCYFFLHMFDFMFYTMLLFQAHVYSASHLLTNCVTMLLMQQML